MLRGGDVYLGGSGGGERGVAGGGMLRGGVMYTWEAAEEVREVWLGGDVGGGGVMYTLEATEEVREVWLGGDVKGGGG